MKAIFFTANKDTPLRLYQHKLERQHIIQEHLLSKIDRNFPLVLLTGVGAIWISIITLTQLDVKVKPMTNCYVGIEEMFLPHILLTAMAGMVQIGIFYLFPYYQLWNQLHARQIDENFILNQTMQNRKGNAKLYNSAILTFFFVCAATFLYHLFSKKHSYCKIIGINNLKCQQVYMDSPNLSREIRQGLMGLTGPELAAFTLDPQKVNNIYQDVVHEFQGLPQVCSDLLEITECFSKVLSFIQKSNAYQKYTSQHEHVLIQTSHRLIQDAFLLCVQHAFFDRTSPPALLKQPYIQNVSLLISFLVLSNLGIFFGYTSLISWTMRHVEEKRYHYLEKLCEKISDITLSNAAPGFYRIDFKKRDDQVHLDELLYLLETYYYCVLIKNHNSAIISNSNFFLYMLGFQKLSSATEFKLQYKKKVLERQSLEKAKKETLSLLHRLSVLSIAMHWEKQLVRKTMKNEYHLSLTIPHGCKVPAPELLSIIKIMLPQAYLISCRIVVIIEKITPITHQQKENYEAWLSQLTANYLLREDIIAEKSRATTNRKILSTFAKEAHPEVKSIEYKLEKITDAETQEAFLISIENHSPLNGRIFSVMNTMQNLACYFIFTQALINVLTAYKDSMSLSEGLTGMLRIVGPEGERGFNVCDKKSAKLKLSSCAGRPVNIQYKDPGSKFRIWGERRRTIEKVPFYVMHTLVEKVGDTGKNYKICKLS